MKILRHKNVIKNKLKLATLFSYYSVIFSLTTNFVFSIVFPDPRNPGTIEIWIKSAKLPAKINVTKIVNLIPNGHNDIKKLLGI